MKFNTNYEQYYEDNESNLTESQKLRTLIDDFYNGKLAISKNPYGCVSNLIDDKLINHIEFYIEEVNEINRDELSNDELIWCESFLYNLNLELNNHLLGVRYLGGNPSDMDKCFPLTYYNMWMVDNLNDVIDIFVRDDNKQIVYQNNEPTIDQSKYDKLEFKVKAYIEYLEQLKDNLTCGMLANIMLSRITTRLTARNHLINLYPKELSYFAKNQQITKNIPNEYQTNYASKYVHLINVKKYTDLMVFLQKHVDNFMQFYIGEYVPFCLKTEYSYGGSFDDLLSFDDSREEIEQSYTYTENDQMYKIYGLGLTKEDLDNKEIGLSAMMTDLGKDLYQHYLNVCSTTGYNAQQIFDLGYQLTLDNYQKMKLVASEIANILKDEHNNFQPIVQYDSDGVGPKLPETVTCNVLVNNVLNLDEFNKWLNQENAFFGREINYWTPNKIESIINNSQSIFEKSKNKLEQFGYNHWMQQKTVDNRIGAIAGINAYCGAITSIVDADIFHLKTIDYFHSYFNKLNQDYEVLPYDICVQEIWGAGQEGLNMFQFNVNPYFSEHKWAFPSFIIHEGAPGHHTQLAYWTKYFKGQRSPNNKPIPYFSSTAFHEGWAVFCEWWAASLNFYDVNIKNDQIIYLNEKDNFFNQIDLTTYHNGFYYQLVEQSPNTQLLTDKNLKTNTVNKIAKLLCFYGFLNAAQIRNIRLVVDTALHAPIISKCDDINGLCSIQDVRNFMRKYCAIGIGDSINESKRYLAWPAQATSYMLGNVVIKKLYLSIFNNFYNANGEALSNQLPTPRETQPLFDLMLRNGEIPLKVLENIIIKTYKI